MPEIPDESWADVARASRHALALLGRPIGPNCLPGEPEHCGGSFALHACAHLAVLKAIADHQLDHHLGTAMSAAGEEIYQHTMSELFEGCPDHA